MHVKHQIKNKWSQQKKILQPKTAEPQKLCNCLVKEDCPLNGLCLTSSILYQTTIKCSNSKYKQKRYKGICEMTFNKRYANHKKSFNWVNSKNYTILSVEYRSLKQKQQAPRLTSEIKGQYKTYNLKKYNLCLNEKLAIIDDPDKNLLNKRSEVISQCRHQNKFSWWTSRQVKHQMTSYNRWYPSIVLFDYGIV